MNNPFFPESLWPPVDPRYKSILDRGVELASYSNVYICGICRDCEKTIGANLSRIDFLSKFFKSTQIFIYENDSQDFTPSIVESWAKNRYNIVFRSEKLGTSHQQDKSLNRRSNLAKARNQYLEYGHNLLTSRFDLMIVLDLDLAGGWSYEGIIHSIGLTNSKSIIGSNSLIYNPDRKYYDSWAYRELGSDEELTDYYVNTLVFNRGEPMRQVNSCFGGCAIYPISVLKHNFRYHDYDCDHVTYHKQLRDVGYDVYLNPSQITLYSENYYT